MHVSWCFLSSVMRGWAWKKRPSARFVVSLHAQNMFHEKNLRFIIVSQQKTCKKWWNIRKKHAPTLSWCGSCALGAIWCHVRGGVEADREQSKWNSLAGDCELQIQQRNNQDWPKTKGFGRRLEAGSLCTSGNLTLTSTLSAEVTATNADTSSLALLSSCSEKSKRSAMPGMYLPILGKVKKRGHNRKKLLYSIWWFSPLLCVASCSPPAELGHAFRDHAPVQVGFKGWLGAGQMCSFSSHWHFVGLTFGAPSNICLDQTKTRPDQSQREPRQTQVCFQPQRAGFQ